MKNCILPSLVGLALLTLAAPVYSQTPDDLNPGADNFVYATAIQPDGKILVGGSFTTLGGQSRSCIGRLNADGTLDTAFNPGASGLPVPWAVPTSVHCLAVQADGKILVGGYFTTLGGQPRNCIGRLNPDGTVDPAFNPGIDAVNHYCFLWCLAVQADGKILVGGYFTQLGGQPRSFIGRLNSNGTLDTDFNPGAGSTVYCLAIQTDGRIVVGGIFKTLAGAGCNYLGRLNADGTRDTGFNPGPNSDVRCVVCQPDGNILVAGSFTSVGGQPRHSIGRLNSNGTADLGFDPGLSSLPCSLALQADGRIVVGGVFTTLGGQPRSNLGRLNADGTLDPSLNQGTDPSFNGTVYSVAVQTDGKILVAGNFATLAGQPRSRIGRFNCTDPATQSLTCDATSITWLRGGVTPEVARTRFDASTNGTDWVNLGAGTRISGGWQLTGIPVPTNALIRALGYVTGGSYDGSAWMVETILSAPRVFSQPTSQTNGPGSVATFSVVAGGIAPLSYQWLKDGVGLEESGNVSGVQTPTLTLSNLARPDESGYSVIISNNFGSVTSLVATLTVLDPVITGQPVSQNANAGDAAAFSVTALGTAPLDYQWRKDGVAVAGATDASLTLTNLQRADAGCYDVVVSNGFGTVTSAVASLTVNLASADAFNPSANGTVYTTAIQADGKILVGGAFLTLGGQSRANLGRLNADGTLDTNFNAGANGTVDTLAVQADGKILVGGSFTTLGGQSRNRIGRFSSDGTLDTSFNPGANSSVYCLAPQADGKILVGGAFSWLGGPQCTNVGRLNADGTQDTNFHANASGSVYSLTVQADGTILIGGAFTTLNGQPRSHLGRVNADGSLDSTFNPGAGSTVSGLAAQADGKILVGGYFLTLGGQPRNYIGRLNSDGSLDSAFNPGANDYVYSLAVQADGRIQVGGNFTALGGQARNRMGRLNNDGTLDLTFNPGASGCVYSLAQETDGTTLVGGSFTTLGGQPRNGMGRLSNTDPAMQSLACDAAKITWLRGGTSPEVSRTSVEASTNGNDWISLGTGARIAGGWQFTGVAVPANATIRARGLATGGQYNRSSWIVETNIVTSLPLILSQPLSQTNYVGTDANFSLVAGGTPPLSYQWLKDGTSIAGATAPLLALTNVQPSAQGSYSVVVSNAFGSTASSPACLVVNQRPCRFTSVCCESDGRVKVRFFATAGLSYVVGASTNLVTWEVIGQAEEQADGTFVFEDTDAAMFPYRYYRIQD
jgi:uncharacterized delta-60 repeat protein